MGFSKQEYWSGLACPPQGDLPDSGMEAVSLMSPALAGEFFTISTTWEAQLFKKSQINEIRRIFHYTDNCLSVMKQNIHLLLHRISYYKRKKKIPNLRWIEKENYKCSNHKRCGMERGQDSISLTSY